MAPKIEMARDVTVLRRVNLPPYAGLFSLWGVFVVGMGLCGITDGFTTWRVPFWEYELPMEIFFGCFLTFWFGFGLFWIWMVMRPLQSVRVSGDEVCICLGPLVLKRLPVTEIRTVVKVGYRQQGQAPYTWEYRLVLCTTPAELLREQSRSFRSRSRMKHQELHMKDGIRVPDKAVKHFLRHSWKHNRFWLDWSEYNEQILRDYLTTTIFIV